MNIIAIIILVALALIVFVKLAEMKHKILLKVILVLVAFVIGTLGYVYFKHDINISTYDGFVSLGRVYFSWLGGLFKNMGSITGYAVQQSWGMNSTGVA